MTYSLFVITKYIKTNQILPVLNFCIFLLANKAQPHIEQNTLHCKCKENIASGLDLYMLLKINWYCDQSHLSIYWNVWPFMKVKAINFSNWVTRMFQLVSLNLLSQKQPADVLYKRKVFLNKKYSNFTRKHLNWSLFSIKLQALRPATLSKRDSNTGVILSNSHNF